VEILRLAAQGSNSQKIAQLLHLSPATVDNHFQHILKKLNAHSRLEAIRKAQLARLL
jgi:DNA-binding NarL/FixJ family response regulator